MKNRKVALGLSIVCCGVGQIYNGQVIKGIDLTVIFAGLAASAYFTSGFLRSAFLSGLVFIWLMGMVDAYAFYVDRSAIRKLWLSATPIIIAISLLVFYVQEYILEEETPVQFTGNASLASEKVIEGKQFFSIQVAAFEKLEQAEKLYDRLLYKGYSASIERPISGKEGWYRVLVGRFDTKEEAVPLAEELQKREGVSYIIVVRGVGNEEESSEAQK